MRVAKSGRRMPHFKLSERGGDKLVRGAGASAGACPGVGERSVLASWGGAEGWEAHAHFMLSEGGGEKLVRGCGEASGW